MAQLRLAQQIRSLRKAHGLTQEQLAQAVGVTAGAVYKWEAGLSAPDLSLIVALADLFDTSVDVLLGYELRDNRQQTIVARLHDYRRRKDPAGLEEAERALLKYPNSFAVVHEAARLYFCFGMEKHDRRRLERARILTERLFPLLSQNRDPQLGEASVWGELAQIEALLGRPAYAVEIMKAHNPGGMFNAELGRMLASDCELPDEAAPFLSEAMLDLARDSVQMIYGWLNVYFKKAEYAKAEALLHWGLGLFAQLTKEGQLSFLDKIGVSLRVMLGYLALRRGDQMLARTCLKQARCLAERFDAAPTYSGDRLRYVDSEKAASSFDDLGATAMESAGRLIREELNDVQELSALWREVCADEPD